MAKISIANFYRYTYRYTPLLVALSTLPETAAIHIYCVDSALISFSSAFRSYCALATNNIHAPDLPAGCSVEFLRKWWSEHTLTERLDIRGQPVIALIPKTIAQVETYRIIYSSAHGFTTAPTLADLSLIPIATPVAVRHITSYEFPYDEETFLACCTLRSKGHINQAIKLTACNLSMLPEYDESLIAIIEEDISNSIVIL